MKNTILVLSLVAFAMVSQSIFAQSSTEAEEQNAQETAQETALEDATIKE